MPDISRTPPSVVTPGMTPSLATLGMTPSLATLGMTPSLVTPGLTSPSVTPGLTRGPSPFTHGCRIKSGMTNQQATGMTNTTSN
jgi:hypothetical protein